MNAQKAHNLYHAYMEFVKHTVYSIESKNKNILEKYLE